MDAAYKNSAEIFSLANRIAVKKPAEAGFLRGGDYGFAYKVIAEIAMTAIEIMILHFVFIHSP